MPNSSEKIIRPELKVRRPVSYAVVTITRSAAKCPDKIGANEDAWRRLWRTDASPLDRSNEENEKSVTNNAPQKKAKILKKQEGVDG